VKRVLALVLAPAVAGGFFWQPTPGKAAQATGTPLPRVDACALLTRAQVKEYLPWEALFDQMPLERDDIGETGSSRGYPTVMVQLLAYTPRFIEAVQKVRTQEPVTGVGELAYVSHNPQGYGELVARVGQRTLTVQADIDRGSSYESTKVKAIALAKALAARLK
jgi:hypothetical protein